MLANFIFSGLLLLESSSLLNWGVTIWKEMENLTPHMCKGQMSESNSLLNWGVTIWYEMENLTPHSDIPDI